MGVGVGRCLGEYSGRRSLQERTPARRGGFGLIGLFALLVTLIIGLAVSLTFDLTRTVVGAATRTAAATAAATTWFGASLFLVIACNDVGPLPGFGIGILLGVLTLDTGRFSGCGRCGGGGDSRSCRGTCRLRRRVQGLVGLLRACIAELVASIATASAATAAAAALAVLVRLLGAVVTRERTTIVLTRSARRTAVILIGTFGQLPTAFAAVVGTTTTALPTSAATFAAIATATLAFAACGAFCDFDRLRGLGFDLNGGTAAEPAHQPLKEARRGFGCRRGREGLDGRLLDWLGRRGRDRGGLCGRDALDQRFGLSLDFLFLRRPAHVRGGRVDQIETGLDVLKARVIVAQALDVMVGRFKVTVRDEDQVDLQPRLDLGDVAALLIEKEGGHVDRNLRMHGGRIFLHGLFLQQAQYLERARFRIADHTGTVTTRAGDVRAFVQRGTKALARELHETETRDLAHLDASPVEVQRIAQAVFDRTLILAVFHVDEVDHDQTAKIAKAQLAGHFVRRLEVRARGGLLDVGAARCACGVDVNGHQRFGVVDDHGAARGQIHRARVGRLDLVLDLEARKERHVVPVALDALDVVRHHDAHERHGLVCDVVSVDEDFADFGREVIPDRPDDEARFQVNQDGGCVVLCGSVNRCPELHQVGQVPLQFLDVATDASRAGDNAHTLRDGQLIHRFAKLLAIFAFDATRYAATARIVGHQDQVAAGQRDKGRECGAFVATLFLFNLDNEFLPFAQRILDAGRADVHAFLEVGAGDFLERQEAVALFAVVDEAGLKPGFDPGDDAFVDIAFALFASGGLDVEVDELLPVDDGNAQFFLVRCVEQHAFHAVFLLLNGTPEPDARPQGRLALQHGNTQDARDTLLKGARKNGQSDQHCAPVGARFVQQ